MTASKENLPKHNMEDKESSERGDNKIDVGNIAEANMFMFNYI